MGASNVTRMRYSGPTHFVWVLFVAMGLGRPHGADLQERISVGGGGRRLVDDGRVDSVGHLVLGRPVPFDRLRSLRDVPMALLPPIICFHMALVERGEPHLVVTRQGDAGLRG